MIAEYMNFYGASFRDIMEMPCKWFFKIYQKIHTVEARRSLGQINVVAFPHMDENGREHVHQKLMRDSGYEKMHQEKDASSKYEAGWAILRGFGKKAI
jgi:hypothetical protein